MTLFEKLDKLCKANGINTINVGKVIPGLKAARSTVCEWKTKGNKPRIESIKIIADYFKVPVAYFIDDDYKEEYVKPDGTPKYDLPYHVGELEEELLWVANRLSVKNRAKLVSIAHDMLEKENE